MKKYIILASLLALFNISAFAQDTTPTLDSGNTAWMIVATAFVGLPVKVTLRVPEVTGLFSGLTTGNAKICFLPTQPYRAVWLYAVTARAVLISTYIYRSGLLKSPVLGVVGPIIVAPTVLLILPNGRLPSLWYLVPCVILQ
mgnify:CR=1 FL=1